ncbi:MAG: hypothetical protein ACAH80_10120 [Alphaproteobacteria bacterium]
MGFFTGWFKKATESKETKAQRDLNQEACTACHEGDFKLALELFAQGADPNHIGFRWEHDYDGKHKVPITPAYDAVRHNNEKAMMALIERGLNVNISLAKDGKPLLMHTIESKKERLASILVDHGADTTFVRKDLETCKSLAEAFDMQELLGKMEARANLPPEAQQAVTAMRPIQLKKGATP